MDTRVDLALSVLLTAFGIAVIAVALTIPDGLYRDAIGPRLFPIGVGAVMVFCGAVLTARRILRMEAASGFRAAEEGTGDEPGRPASLGRALVIIALTVGYAAAFVPAGYLIATPVFVAAALYAMQERQPVKVAAISLGWTVTTYVVFAQLLGVRMPVGPFRTLFREWGLINI